RYGWRPRPALRGGPVPKPSPGRSACRRAYAANVAVAFRNREADVRSRPVSPGGCDRFGGWRRPDAGLRRGPHDRLPGGVGVHVLLARQLAELEHDLVGDLAEHSRVVGSVVIALEGHGCREPEGDGHEDPGPHLADGLEL